MFDFLKRSKPQDLFKIPECEVKLKI